VLVVGDGVATRRELMAELVAADARVRFFDSPKASAWRDHRRRATGGRGQIVCYLCDDDLWLPDHVEHLRELLASDFACSQPFWIDPHCAIRCCAWS
jgi:hypothetical protein